MLNPRNIEVWEAALLLKQTIVPTGIAKDYRYDVSIKSLPDKPVITRKGDTLWSSAESGNTWLLYGKEIPGTGNNYLIPEKSGRYSLIVTDENGCHSPVSDIVDFVSGIGDYSGSPVLTVFPNPAESAFTVAINRFAADAGSLKIVGLLGNTVYERAITPEDSQDRLYIDAAVLLPGVYFMVFTQGDFLTAVRFVRL